MFAGARKVDVNGRNIPVGVIYFAIGLFLLAVLAVMSWAISEKAGSDAARKAAAEVRQQAARDNAARRKNLMAGCERGKLDRVDEAAAFAAMARYYQGVTQAESVKPDVKLIAGQVMRVLKRSALGHRSRILVCQPLIDDGEKRPDAAVLSLMPVVP